MSLAEDEREIRNLISRLARFTDIGTVDEYLEAFTDDAVLQIPGLPPRVGLEGLRNGSEAGRQGGSAGPGSHTMHMLGSSSVSIDGDTAVVHTPWVVYRDTVASPTIGSVGRYEDTFVRTPVGWRLRQRMLAFG